MLQLELDVAGELPNVLLDERAIEIAVINLVDNAVLYGGGATIRVEDTPEQLTLHVLDTGPGLPEPDLGDHVAEGGGGA